MTGDFGPPRIPFREAVRAWFRIALSSFGGPAGQISVIHRVIVEEKRWIDEPRFLHALSYCMLLPGPEAQQLATYLGWLLHGTRGALVAGSLFILPGFLAILVLSLLYVSYRGTTLVAAIFFGLKPAVFAIVLVAVARLGRRALKTRFEVLLAGMAFVAVFALRIPFPVVVIVAALLGYLVHRRDEGLLDAARPADLSTTARPSVARLLGTIGLWLIIWLVPVGLLFLIFGPGHILTQEGVFFSKVALVTFGGAYAVLAYVAQQAVESFHWLSSSEMLDGLGLAESTPGPLIMVVQFVGFLGAHRAAGELAPMTAGILGSVVTTWVTFAPCFLFILAGAPWIEYLRGNRGLNAALTGIMAAVVGVVLNLAVWFGLHTFFGALTPADVGPFHLQVPTLTTAVWPALLIAAAAWIALTRFRVGMLPVMAGAVLAGIGLEAFR